MHSKTANGNKFAFLNEATHCQTVTDIEGDLRYLLLLVEVREHGETALAAKLGAPHDDGFVGRDGDVQVSRIRLAHLGHTQVII